MQPYKEFIYVFTTIIIRDNKKSIDVYYGYFKSNYESGFMAKIGAHY